MLDIGLGYLGAGWGAGVIMLAAAGGIAKLSAAALEGKARQQEAAGNLLEDFDGLEDVRFAFLAEAGDLAQLAFAG